MSNNLDQFVQLYLEQVPHATENELKEEYGHFKKQFVSMYGGAGDKERIPDALIGLFIITFMVLYQLSDTLSDIMLLDYALGHAPLSGVVNLVNMDINQFFAIFAGLIIILLIIGGIYEFMPPANLGPPPPPTVHSAEWLAQEQQRQEQQQERIRQREESQRQRAQRQRQLREDEENRRGKTGGATDMLLEALQKVNLDGNKLFMKAMMVLSNIFRKFHLGLDKKQAEHIANGLDYIINHPKNVKGQLIKLFKPVRAMTEKEYGMVKEILKNNKEIEVNVMKMLKN